MPPIHRRAQCKYPMSSIDEMSAGKGKGKVKSLKWIQAKWEAINILSFPPKENTVRSLYILLKKRPHYCEMLCVTTEAVVETPVTALLFLNALRGGFFLLPHSNM